MKLSATTLIGDHVKNGSGKDLGKIEDLMIDVDDSNVSYAVLSFGGFLGMGDKLFAVPLQAMSIDASNRCLVLKESKERLENAPGFDKDHWPDHSDPAWNDQVRSYYNLALNATTDP